MLSTTAAGVLFSKIVKSRIDAYSVLITERRMNILRQLWLDEAGQDIAEYAVMLAVILVLVVGTIRLVGSNANNAFSQVASSMNQ